MFRYVGTLVFAFSAVALGAAGDISKVNGSIDVAAGQQAGDVSTVNGSITVGSRPLRLPRTLLSSSDPRSATIGFGGAGFFC